MLASFDIKIIKYIKSSNKVLIIIKNIKFKYIKINLFYINVKQINM